MAMRYNNWAANTPVKPRPTNKGRLLMKQTKPQGYNTEPNFLCTEWNANANGICVSLAPDVCNEWNRLSMAICVNRYQFNWLISIINGQSMRWKFVTIDCYRISIIYRLPHRSAPNHIDQFYSIYCIWAIDGKINWQVWRPLTCD